jgi:hypothetical protein
MRSTRIAVSNVEPGLEPIEIMTSDHSLIRVGVEIPLNPPVAGNRRFPLP